MCIRDRCILAYKVYGCLLVGHAEYHFGIVAVGEAQQLIADAIVTAGLIPQRSRHDNRELHFLAVDFVHLLAQDPVSYTHLDVYKRQSLLYSALPESRMGNHFQ